MSDEEIETYEKDKLTFFERYILLSDIFLSNQGKSKIEIIFYLTFFYLQLLSGFFSPQIGMLDTDNKIDSFLLYIEKITRLKNFFRNDYKNYKRAAYCLFFFFLISGSYFYFLIKITNRQSFYDFKKKIFIYLYKFFMYVAYNIILDMTFANFCFKGDKNYIILEASCSFKDNFFVSIIYIFCFIYSTFMNFVIQIFHNDSFQLSNSYFSKSCCNYDFLMIIHSIIYSFILNQTYISKYFFLFYNLIASIFFYIYYLYIHLFLEKSVFMLSGLFHCLYIWTSFIFFIFYIFPIENLGFVLISSSFLITLISYRITFYLDYQLIYKTPFSKIKNKYYVLYFIKEIVRIINNLDEDEEKKSLLNGLLEIHKIECLNPKCITKLNKKIYLPKTDEWSNNEINMINNKILLQSFIISLLNFWLSQNNPFPNILITLSLYYLKDIGNVCQSIYILKKIQRLKLTLSEYFNFCRLKIKVRNYLFQRLKVKNKPVYSLEELNYTLYFKYEDLSKQFVQEITNDLNYSLLFWNNLKNTEKSINYNDYFKLTEKIRITKIKISKLFNELFSIYNGINDLFELYSSYIEIVNSDYIIKRNLEIIKKKYDRTIVDIIKMNYYTILFGKETGILIGNGDKGHEGQILTCNKNIIDFFGYSRDELKGKFCSILMPKNLARIHSTFIKNYFTIGKKNVLGKTSFKSFAQDKDNNIFMINITVNNFPILNNSVLFIAMLLKEKNEDLILIDNYYNIQGMTSHLFSKLNIEKKELFKVYDIPFYAICPQFTGLYKNMIIIKNKKLISTPSTITKKGMSDIKRTISGIVQKVINKQKSNNFEQILFTPKSNNEIPEYDFNHFKNSNNSSSISNIKNKSYQRPSFFNSQSSPQRSFFFRPSLHNDKSIDKSIILEDISNLQPPQKLLDKNETIELECEIKIPPFILNFRGGLFKKEDSVLNIDSLNDEFNDESSFEENSLNDDEQLITKAEDKESFNKNSKVKKSSIPLYNKTFKSMNLEKNKNRSEKSEEEIIFLNKINKYKIYFLKGEFNELKDYINHCNNEEILTVGTKFNLLFEKFRFGPDEISYCIKVMENKDIEDSFEDDNIKEEEDLIINLVSSQIEKKNKEYKYIKKVKTENLQKLYSLFPEERKGLIALYKEFLKISNEDQNFKNLLVKNIEEIKMYSSIHGNIKQDMMLDDENSSQSSSTYNEGLSKKNRIEEIRNNALKKINDYYLLRYYRIIILIIILCFAAFLPIILILFDSLCNNLSEVTKINNKLYQTTNWISFLLSSLISFHTFYLVRTNINENKKFKYNLYCDSLEQYIYTLRNYSFEWIDIILTNFSLVEKAIATFTQESKDLLWEKENVLNMNQTYNSSEPYPFALVQILDCANNLINDEIYINYILGKNEINDYQRKYISYRAHTSINNAYRLYLPSNLEKIKDLPALLQDFNNNSLHNIRYANILYAIIIFILICIYTLIIYKTNKNIDEGFEKISKIKRPKIHEIIKNLAQFNIILKKYIEINYEDNHYFDTKSFHNYEFTTSIERKTHVILPYPDSLGINNNQDENYKMEMKKKSNESYYHILDIDNENIKTLQLFKYSYLQPIILAIICLEFIISTLLITKTIVTSSNEIINVQTFIYQLTLSASTSLLDLKYSLTYLQIEHNITYVTQSSNFSLQEVMNRIAKFDDILILYNNMQINVCEASFNSETQKDYYEFCLNDEKVKNVNNTNSIFDSIENEVETLFELMKYYISEDPDYNTKLLYSSVEIKKCEYLFYNYLIFFIDNIAAATLKNQQKKLDNNRSTAIIFYILVILELLVYAIYVLMFFLKRIVYLLSVARSIFRIIPINVIYSTQELSSWIENNFNS